jgi:hypothetical protein
MQLWMLIASIALQLATLALITMHLPMAALGIPTICKQINTIYLIIANVIFSEICLIQSCINIDQLSHSRYIASTHRFTIITAATTYHRSDHIDYRSIHTIIAFFIIYFNIEIGH